MVWHAILLVGFFLTAQLCGCTAYVGGGLSVEFIHRDSPKSPFHDPKLTVHGRVLAAARRSTERAAALARSYATIGSPGPDGAVSEITSRPFDYLMYVYIGTPRTRILAMADTGSNLVWLRCVNASTASGGDAPADDDAFDVSTSGTYGRLGCHSGACIALPGGCDANSNCNYLQTYADGANTTGLLSIETFTFDDAPGGCVGCRDRPQLVVHEVNFGCATSINGRYFGNGVIGLGPGIMSLVSQIGASTPLGRRFSYCLVPYNVNASSALNFGSRASVTEVDAVTTTLVRSNFYTVALESVKINNSTFTIPQDQSHLILDSGTSMTFLHQELLDQVVAEVNRTIKLPQVPSVGRILSRCYDATGMTEESILEKIIPDVKLVMGGSAVVTLKARNTFVQVDKSTVCMALLPVGGQSPFAILGNVAQQNMHVGYDLDKQTVTFAAADCTTAYTSHPASL
ncbi:hypothetical protein QYE76_050233 [Lolium multiflorum]|uniref:Peptidase A1 domain-containing protein n=1 Tax=Lolium multiflorum TaxID=4521 RepID=A0AAD8SQI4_LOLMU|nr:hypothetical protein QYE76_050233 [Lolium multiflorum]